MNADEIAAHIQLQGLPNLLDLARGSRRLVHIDPESRPIEPTLGPILAPIFDPEGPSPTLQGQPTPVRSSRWIGTLLLIGLMAALAITGDVVDDEFTGLAEMQDMLSSLLKG